MMPLLALSSHRSMKARVTVKDDVGRAAEKAVDTVGQVLSDLLHPFGVGVRRRTRDFNAPRL